jgi:hypothetical protein
MCARSMMVIALIWMMPLLAGCGGTEPAAKQALSQPELSSAAVTEASSPDVSAAAVSPTQVSYLGDLDGDGSPSVADAILILRIVVGLDFDDTCADVNKNDSTDVGDAILVLRCVVGLQTWPIGQCGGDDPYPPPPPPI